MNQNSETIRELYKLVSDAEKKIFPPVFNHDKKDIIDFAFNRCGIQVRSFADLGGVWGVDGAYTFYTLERYNISQAYLIDTDINDAVRSRAQNHPHLQPISGNFGDFNCISLLMQPVDAIFMFDVLLHQVKPNWDEVLAYYAARTSILVIYNQQFTSQESTVRLLDLGHDGYFENVPHSRYEAPYMDLFQKLDQENPQHKRPWRDVHNIWQWGITDKDLLATLSKLGFSLQYFRNCGQFGYLKNFENHAFVFKKNYESKKL